MGFKEKEEDWKISATGRLFYGPLCGMMGRQSMGRQCTSIRRCPLAW